MASRILTEDLWYFVNCGSGLSLSTPTRASRFLREQHATLEECHPTLAEFPAVQVECLTFWYWTLRGIGMLEDGLLDDLLAVCGWRGIVWGGWLALMHPTDALRPALATVRRTKHRNEWAVECAKARIAGTTVPADLRDLDDLACQCRHLLGGFTPPPMPLRREPSSELAVQLDGERHALRRAYREQPLQDVLTLLKSSRLYEYSDSYPRWFRRRASVSSRRTFVEQVARGGDPHGAAAQHRVGD